MFQIDDTIISSSVIEAKFSCDLNACRGACCRYGDSGAPLLPEETLIIDRVWTDLWPFLRPEGIRAIEEQGTSLTDMEGDLVTPLINNEECAYTIIEDGIFRCGIETAFNAGAIKFRKPLSCHLFPVRVKDYTDFRAVNYEELHICRSAVTSGKRGNVALCSFLKEPLIRAFGNEWYDQLIFVITENEKNNTQWNR